MILAYVAGPYTADTDEAIEANILAAEAVARELIERTDSKVSPIIPHSIGRNFKHGPGDYQYWIAATLEMLKPCDCLVTVPGWERSSGARGEVEWCRAHGTPVFHSVDRLIEWIESKEREERDL